MSRFLQSHGTETQYDQQNGQQWKGIRPPRRQGHWGVEKTAALGSVWAVLGQRKPQEAQSQPGPSCQPSAFARKPAQHAARGTQIPLLGCPGLASTSRRGCQLGGNQTDMNDHNIITEVSLL